jgi:hypothetical protein
MPRAFSYLILSHLKQNPGHASATRHAQRCVCQFPRNAGRNRLQSTAFSLRVRYPSEGKALISR